MKNIFKKFTKIDKNNTLNEGDFESVKGTGKTEKNGFLALETSDVVGLSVEGESAEITAAPKKKKKFGTLRAAIVCLLIFTVICGIIYPVSVTLISQAIFPYEANGSQIIVTMPNGTQVVYGSELIGQQFETADYLFGRVNTGAPTNLSPESDEYKALLLERIEERRQKLQAIGYTETSTPSELITSSGSGVDPHISPEAAEHQVPIIVAARNFNAETDADKITEKAVRAIIKKYTEGRFWGIFGEKRVNVLLVNLALDKLI